MTRRSHRDTKPVYFRDADGGPRGAIHEDMKTITMMRCTGQEVGDVVLLGRFGGAYCSHWRIVAVTAMNAVLIPVREISNRNTDGTYSTTWEPV